MIFFVKLLLLEWAFEVIMPGQIRILRIGGISRDVLKIILTSVDV